MAEHNISTSELKEFISDLQKDSRLLCTGHPFGAVGEGGRKNEEAQARQNINISMSDDEVRVEIKVLNLNFTSQFKLSLMQIISKYDAHWSQYVNRRII